MQTPSFTMLNAMADKDFETALDRHVAWGLKHLDLKGGILGNDVVGLSTEEAGRAKELADERALSVYCLSTTLFDEFVEAGEWVFRGEHLGKIDRLIEVADVLEPHFVRLLAAKTRQRQQTSDAIRYVNEEHPWLMDLYREASERLIDAGHRVTIENECHDCIFATTDEIIRFFETLDCGDAVSLTWDVQNLWQMGTFPTLHIYEALKPLIAYYHVKGGQSESERGPLRWRSSLEDASWPVEEITGRVVADGVSPVICLNSSHGERKEGYDYEGVTERDLEFMRRVTE